ncbi:MAG: TonB-dependent receptor plug domain-containing protein, partial [Rhodospirillaceae bacterium]|nr:TonB-dependent receptor plug domain-containing protein [Rhodospirillaceae bacterium]
MSMRAVLLSGCAAVIAAAAGAQTPAQQQAAAVEEIIVTAQKREQTLREVPLTVTAYSGEFLSRIGVEEFDALSSFVPGLVVQEQSVNNPGFVIRGITSDSGQANIAPRVSVYHDGVDVSRSRGSIFELHDIERVEVVKGPQATLFGTAASVGAISVISARPQ